MCCDHFVGWEWSGMFIYPLFWLPFMLCSVTCFCQEAVGTRKEQEVCLWNWNKEGFPTGMASCDWKEESLELL